MNPSIVFLPVDERFCTRDYFLLLSEAGGIKVKTPPKEYLGRKKIAADIERIWKWLETNVEEDDILILSLDMLLHGGLIPSRMSLESTETVGERIERLKLLKKRGTKLYISATITRAPFYDSSEEEPDYWEYFGKKIYDFTRAAVNYKTGDSAFERVKKALEGIPAWIVRDFTIRRARNFKMITKAVELVKNGTIDYLNLTLDDNSEGSLSLSESKRHTELIKKLGLEDRTSVHPGADESTLTLLSKSLCDHFGISPKFRTVYTEPDFKRFIPAYEGSPLEESVANHIAAAGGTMAEKNWDILFIVHNPTDRSESPFQPVKAENEGPYDLFGGYAGEDGKVIGIADGRYTNGADNRLVEKLFERSRDWTVTNYAGWNTVGNTVGTVCAVSVVQHMGRIGFLEIDTERMQSLNAVFLIEHWGFQANVRQILVRKMMEKGVKMWTVMPLEGFAVDLTRTELQPYFERIETAFGRKWKEFGVTFPWHRSFELGVELGS